jgi:enoyl-CoA hydratase/carnithine racemase
VSASSELEVVDDGPIRHLILNRPAKLNTMTQHQHQRVIDALDAAQNDETIRVVAFSGQGRAFCAGDDLTIAAIWNEPHAWPARYKPHLIDLEIGVGPKLLQEVTSRIRDFPKATAVLMHGYAIGAGYDYALSCDLRLIERSCKFGDPRIHRALWSAEGWAYKLPRLVAGGHVSKVAYMGEFLSGEEAVETGLAHGLLEAEGDIREHARSRLMSLASQDPKTYRATKYAMLNSLELPYEAAVHDQGTLSYRTF